MKNAWNQEINLKKMGKKVLPASKDKNPARILKENDKNWWRSQVPTRRERGTLKKNWIVTLKKSYSAFLKTRNTSFDRSKIILDRSKQTETPTLKNFKLLKISIGRKKHIGPIESGRGSPNFSGKHNFCKIKRFNSKHLDLRTKMHEYEMIWFSKQEF